MSLQDLKLEDTYSSDTNDLITDFYNPILANAILYDRISGFFSPKVLALAARGFSELISNEGKIRLITSIKVDDSTFQLIQNGAEFNDELLDMSGFTAETVQTQIEKDYLSVFSWLYSTGRIEMKIAITDTGSGIMHQKVGIITDADGKSISFSGSNNETFYGWNNNIEEFKVFKNWRIATASFYASDRAKFDRLWNNTANGVRVLNVNDATKERIIKSTSTHEDISIVVKRLKDHKTQQPKIDKIAKKRELFDFQKDAIKHWFDNDCKSIFEMATGTGKTFTSINALKEFRAKNGYLRAVIVVPLTTLTIQWKNDIREIIDDIQIINTSTDDNWRETLHSLYLSLKLGQKIDYIIITTYKMFPVQDFTKLINQLDGDLILVTDEMHNLVTERGTEAAQQGTYKFKLGLSATPTRLWRPSESYEVAKLFGDNRFTYDISEAIENKFLVPFKYHPIQVQLNIDEYEEYVDLSRLIGRMYAAKDTRDFDPEKLLQALRKRARIKKNASAKIQALSTLAKQLIANNKLHHALIYVDNQKFLGALQEMLTENNIISTKFIGSTPLDDRLKIINRLRSKDISAIVAIKCLDEGVDIPSAQTAFFLSNNTDPREYVQRLGRVLRVDREGHKEYANIYDYLVMPPVQVEYEDDTERTISRNLIKGELIRSKFFESLALNSGEANIKIADFVDGYGFYYEDDELVYNVGEES